MMKRLYELIQCSEAWLIERILQYVRQRGYEKYTPTFAETCRVAIAGLSRALLREFDHGARDLEINPNDDYTTDPAAAFVTLEAGRHRARGVSISMFLGLFKYYRQTYMDLLDEAGLDADEARNSRLFLNRFFDRIEIAFCSEWNGKNNGHLLDELRGKNRKLTNEKNKYLTIFESLYDPALLLDEERRIVNINLGAARLFDETAAPGELYYAGPESSEKGPLNGVDVQILMPWLDPELTDFFERAADKTVFEKSLRADAGAVHYQVSLSRMLDVSGKFTGVIVSLKNITRQKEYENALIREKEISRTYLNVAGVIMLALDTAGNVTMINKKGCEILGYEQEEILGCCWFDTCLPAAQANQVRGMFREIMSGNLVNPEYMECSVITKSGEIRTIAWHKTLLLDEHGRITGCLSSGEDITEYKQAEESLRKSEMLLRSSIDAMCSPFAIINADTLDIEMANDAYCGQDDIGKKCHFVSHARETPCCHEEHPCPLPLIRQTGKPVVLEHIHFDRQGNPRNMEVHAYPLFDKNGRLIRMIETSIDITERRRAEEALHKSETRLRTMYETSRDAVMLLDEKGFFDCNEATLRMFGCDDIDAFCAFHPADLSPAFQPCGTNSLTLANQRIATAMEKGSNYFEWMHQRSDTGQVFPATVLLSRMILDGRTVLQATVRDITERKETAEKLKQTMAELERSNSELEQFAYAASHDLQEPLRMITRYMQLLSLRYEGRLDEKADKYIHYAVDGAVRMKKQIAALLAYSKIESGGRSMAPVNCNDIVRQVLINLNESVRQSGAEVTRGELPTINADAQLLVYIFQNLIGNAVKFRNGLAPRVRVEARQQDGAWLFLVSDNGIGIDARHQEKIFQLFQRLHSKSEYEGTGIGLALVRKAVEHHKGRIWVESEPGNGATFFFTIPN